MKVVLDVPGRSANTLSADLALEKAAIDPSRRPETLTLAELVVLADAFAGAVL